MYPSEHFFYGLIFTISLFLIFPSLGGVGALLILASTFLIDVDHYLYYFYKKKDWSLKKAYQYCDENLKRFQKLSKKKQEKAYGGLFFLHGLDVLLIIFLLGVFVSKIFSYIFIGFAFHLLLDSIHQATYKRRIDKVFLIQDLLRTHRLKEIGDYKK